MEFISIIEGINSIVKEAQRLKSEKLKKENNNKTIDQFTDTTSLSYREFVHWQWKFRKKFCHTCPEFDSKCNRCYIHKTKQELGDILGYESKY